MFQSTNRQHHQTQVIHGVTQNRHHINWSTGHPNERSKGLDWRSGAVKTWLGNFPAPNMGVLMRGYRSPVGGLSLTILKHMSSSMGRIIPYIVEKLKKCFQTTNQINADFPLPRLTSEGYVYLLKWDI